MSTITSNGTKSHSIPRGKTYTVLIHLITDYSFTTSHTTMKKTLLILAVMALCTGLPHAKSQTLPAFSQSGVIPSDADLDAQLKIPRGVQAPALKRFYVIVSQNGTPSQQDYQNLVNEYQVILNKIQGLQQMYARALQCGSYPLAMQTTQGIIALALLKNSYEMLISQYNVNQYITN